MDIKFVNDQIARIARDAIERKVFPGTVIGYIADNERHVFAFGRHTYEPDSPEVTPDLLYDGASITKVLPTNTLIMMLIDEGRLCLDDLAKEYLPELANGHEDVITIRHLLCYMVAPALPTNLTRIALEDPPGLLDRLFHMPLIGVPGATYTYNDTAIIWLGLIAERVSGKKLDVLAAEKIFEPMGLGSATLHPDSSLDIAPSEINHRGLVQFEVHDETAWVLGQQGIVSGNAGIVIETGDLVKFAEMLLNQGVLNGQRFLSEEIVREIYTNQYPGVTPYAGLGWFLNQDVYFGTKIGPHTFGMTGYTGSMVLIDPDMNRAVVMGSNRVYPQRTYDRDGINEIRHMLAGLVLPAIR